MSVGIASLASSVLMSVMYVLFLRHPSEKDETETSKEPADKAVVKAKESKDKGESTEEVVAHESASATTNENGSVKKRRTIRKEDAATDLDQNSVKVSTVTPTPSLPKKVWYIKIMNGIKNTKFSFIITLKCMLLFVANTLSYFVAKGIQDWIGTSHFCCCFTLFFYCFCRACQLALALSCDIEITIF